MTDYTYLPPPPIGPLREDEIVHADFIDVEISQTKWQRLIPVSMEEFDADLIDMASISDESAGVAEAEHVRMASCSAPHENADLTGIYCELPEGHPLPHQAMRPVEWWDDDQP